MSRRSYFRQVGVTGVLFILASFVSDSFLQAQGQPAVMGTRTRLSQKMGMGSGQMQGSPMSGTAGTMGGMQNPRMNGMSNAGMNGSMGTLPLNDQGKFELEDLVNLFQTGPTVVEETAGTYTQHEGAITSLKIDSSGYYVLTGSMDKTAQLWRLKTDFQNDKERLSLFQEKVFKNEDNHKLGVTDAIFSPDESMVLTSSYDRSIRLWDKKQENRLVFLGAKDRVWGVAVDPNGYFIAGVCNNGEILIWQPKPPEIVGRFLLPKTKDGLNIPIYDINFDSTGEYLVVACADGSVRLWYLPAIIDKTNLQLKKQLEKDELSETENENEENENTENNSDKNADASKKTINSVSLDFIEPINPGEKRQFGESLIIRGHGVNGDQVDPEPFVYSAVFSDDNSCILTAGRDKTARIWDSRTGQEVCRFVGHTGAVRKAIFYGNYVLTASDDGTVRLWSYSLQNPSGSGNMMNNGDMMGGNPYSMGTDYPSMGPAYNQMGSGNPGMMNPSVPQPVMGNKGPVGLQQGPMQMTGPPASSPYPAMGGPMMSSPSMAGEQSSFNTQPLTAPIREFGINKGTEMVCFKTEGDVSVFSVGITEDAYYVLAGCSDGIVRIWQNPLVQNYSNIFDPNASGYGSGGYGVPGESGFGYGSGGYGTEAGYGSGTGYGTRSGTQMQQQQQRGSGYAPGMPGNSPSNYRNR